MAQNTPGRAVRSAQKLNSSGHKSVDNGTRKDLAEDENTSPVRSRSSRNIEKTPIRPKAGIKSTLNSAVRIASARKIGNGTPSRLNNESPSSKKAAKVEAEVLFDPNHPSPWIRQVTSELQQTPTKVLSELPVDMSWSEKHRKVSKKIKIPVKRTKRGINFMVISNN